MLYCNVFPGSRYDLDALADLGKTVVKRIQRQRAAMLGVYSTDELLEVYAVACFMRNVLEGIEEDPEEDVIDTLLATGPEGVVCAWASRSYEDVPDELYWLGTESDTRNTLYTGYFDVPFASIWSARKVPPPESDEPATKYILDTVVGSDDTCSQCAAPGGLKLLTEANWDRLGVDLQTFLKGQLQNSPTVTASFSAATKHLQKSDDLGPWIAGMFDVKKTPGAWDGWERDMSYCQPCLTKFLEDHVWVWYLDYRVQKGWVPPENCPFGYNCKKIAASRDHVFAKNHLCAPTKSEEIRKPIAPPERAELRQTNVPPLGDDIVGLIMTLCPTFDTLQSTALVSKAFHGVFESHQKSITWAVAYNVVGPALPQAVRVARYPYLDRNRIERRDPDLMALICPEESGATVITTQHTLKLVENARVIRDFENIYSLTQKDRRSRTSVLTPAESQRFQRAAYRIMLYCNIFPASRYNLDELANMEKDTVKAIQRQRTAVLKEYPTDELLEVYAVACFMRDVLEGIEDNAAEDVVDTLLATGPCGVVRAWEARSLKDVPDELHWLGKESDDNNTLYAGYFGVPFARIWSSRKCKTMVQPKARDRGRESLRSDHGRYLALQLPHPQYISTNSTAIRRNDTVYTY
ncbi:hypothetical protein K438DRAFT_1254882 [Mycena galopus ATCC 62051]|nr:hypothetical protein K438DRAFT_1254882 [Mycena galopus ATCC 62051]